MLKLLRKYSLIKYTAAAILIVVPLYPKFPFLAIPGSQVSLRLEDILVLVAFIVFLTQSFLNQKNIFRDPVVVAIILYLAVGLLSTISSIFLVQTVKPHVALLHWLRRVEYMSMFFVGYASVRNSKDLHFFVKCIFLVVFFAFLYGVGQKYFNWPVITTQNEEYAKGIVLRYLPGGHLVSTFAGHYDLASYIILTTPVFVAFFMNSKKSFENYLTTVIFVFMGTWLLVNAASRISLVSYLGSVSFSLFLIKKYKYIPIFILFVIIFVGFTSRHLVDRYIRIINVVMKDRITYVSEIRAAGEKANPTAVPVFEDRSTSIRLNVEWPRAMRAFYKNPILGTGYSSIGLATDNDYLRMIGETGIFGFFTFLLVFFRSVYSLVVKIVFLKDTVGRSFAIGIVSAFSGILLNMVFIDILEASKFAISFWLLLGMAVSTSRN